VKKCDWPGISEEKRDRREKGPKRRLPLIRLFDLAYVLCELVSQERKFFQLENVFPSPFLRPPKAAGGRGTGIACWLAKLIHLPDEPYRGLSSPSHEIKQSNEPPET